MAFPKPTFRGGDFEIAPADTHPARCYQVVDMGMQPNDMYGPRHQIRISWELTEAHMSDGRPFMCSKYYTFSLHEKATLRKDLESWRGRPFTESELEDWTPDALLGAACLLTVQHKEGAKGVRAVVTNVTKVPRGLTVAPLVNATLIYTPDFHDPAAWERLSPKTQEQIGNRIRSATPSTKPAPAAAGGTAGAGFDDEDIPF